MNERIRILQLADQAYDEYETDATKYEDNIPDEFCKKFAELIIQDCIDIIAPYSVKMSKPGEEYLHPIQEIKQHFGVEE